RGQTILHCATKNDHIDVVLYLLECCHRFDINAKDKSQQSALHYSVINNNVEIVQNLVKHGINVNIKDKGNRTAIHWAAAEGYSEILEILLKICVDIDEREEEGKTALHLSSENNHKEAVEKLLAHNCDKFSTDSKGRTALHVASALGHIDVVHVLINNKSAINAKDKKGNTPLHLASLGNHLQVVRTLTEKGAFVNATNSRQQTALHLSAELGFTEIAETLIECGADLSLPERSGRTALYIAARGSFTAIVDMLIKAEREKNQKLRLSGKCSRNSSVERNTSIESNETQGTYSCDHSNGEFSNENFMRKIREILWSLSRNHLSIQDWKRMARHWGFTEEHIKAIEHQYTGKTSYKEHSFRMMLIWLHGVPPCVNPLKELLDTLIAIDRKEVAEKVRRKVEEGNFFQSRSRRCNCFPSTAEMCAYCCVS
ncbi:ankyrin repeat domain containing protein 26-like protein, partial [Leptotrombidium deliense]